MKVKWKIFLSDNKRRIEFFVTLPFFGLVLYSLAFFLAYVEKREGFAFSDPILTSFPPIDLTWVIFAFLYIGITIAFISLIKNPSRMVLALQSVGVLVILRIIAMYLAPFHPPADTILLRDPFVEYLGTGVTLTKDLFFSGHTATLFLLFLICEDKKTKYILFLSTILVGISVLLQHVHYSIDVFAAPLFAYTAYKGTFYLKNYINTQKI